MLRDSRSRISAMMALRSRCRADGLAPPDDEQLAGESGAALGGGPDLLDVGVDGGVAGGLLGYEGRVVQDDAEQVVEVVRHAPG